jgi:hypothetical protein
MIIFFGLIYCSPAQESKKQDTISPEKEQDIIYLLKTSGTADFAYIIIDDVIQNYKQYLADTPDGYWEKIAVKTDIMPFIHAIVPVYDKRFTHEEIKQLIAFFDSPIGNKWALSLKDMNQEVMKQANLFGQNIFSEINKILIKDGYIVAPEVEKSEENTETNNKQNNKK